jgi:hypothetical protein
MVTISNGVKTFRVPSGSVEAYEPAGYRVVDKEEAKKSSKSHTTHAQQQKSDEEIDFNGGESTDAGEGQEPDEDTSFVAELMEKSLSQWSTEETKKFVSIKGIDTTGAKKLSDVKNIIKKYLDEQAKQN